jgi:uncharacterized YccA/Bax inhibitor family protein
MANPLLNESTFKRDGRSTPLPPPELSTRWDGAIVTTAPVRTMTVNATVQATIGLLALLLAAGYVGWRTVTVTDDQVTRFPAWTIALILGGFATVLVASFKPKLAPVLAPVYAVLQGVFVGAISHAYEAYYSGIVLAAIGATLGVFAVMLLLYRFRIIRVTNKFRSIVIGATLGLAVFYLIAIIANAFGSGISIISSPSWLGIGFSVFAASLAALNLLLDFDFIERGERAGAPTYMNWFGALGLLVTLVWLYLEMLRLLSKLRD